MITQTFIAIGTLALLTAGCTSQRFASPPETLMQVQPQTKAPPSGGPYTREREDREYGR
jgi:hypothetical protein